MTTLKSILLAGLIWALCVGVMLYELIRAPLVPNPPPRDPATPDKPDSPSSRHDAHD